DLVEVPDSRLDPRVVAADQNEAATRTQTDARYGKRHAQPLGLFRHLHQRGVVGPLGREPRTEVNVVDAGQRTIRAPTLMEDRCRGERVRNVRIETHDQDTTAGDPRRVGQGELALR